MEKRVSPCMACSRVLDPDACENKNCKAWRCWFIARWDQLRTRLGGDQVTAAGGYLDRDPCEGCPCSGQLCTWSCQEKAAWLEAKRQVGAES